MYSESIFSTVEFISQNKISSREDFFGGSHLREFSMTWVKGSKIINEAESN